MVSQVLYLKWRPQRFEDVVGQEHVTRTLQNALRAGRVAHAYLFAGPRGTGKTTMARLLAKAVNCLDEDVASRPCNKCHICTSINQGRLLDLIEMDAASHTGVDNVREAIREKVGFRPSEARYKVYVIDEVHMLSTSAFNALLKTLEEPPEHVIFCLATTEPHKILPTILSRCQRFDFRRIPLSALVARLSYVAEQEDIHIEDDALAFIARTSTGSARDAISLLDQLTAYGDELITVERLRSVLGLSDIEMVHQLLSHLAARDIGRGLNIINQAVEQGADVRQFAQQVVDTMRSILLARVGGDVASLGFDARTRAELDALAESLAVRDLLRAIKLFNQAQLELRSSDQGQLILELAFVEAAMEESAAAPGVQARAQPTGAAPIATVETVVPASAQPSVRGARKLRESHAAPPAAPPKSKDAPGGAESPSEEELPPASPHEAVLAPEQIRRKQDEISHVLRGQGALGPRADGLFRSVFHIGKISVRGGDRVLLSLPANVLSKVTQEIGDLVERAICSVLDQPCQVCFVEKGAVAEASVDEEREQLREAHPAEQGVQEPASSPYQDVTSDPVVQDLISRGGQVTDVQVLSEE